MMEDYFVTGKDYYVYYTIMCVCVCMCVRVCVYYYMYT